MGWVFARLKGLTWLEVWEGMNGVLSCFWCPSGLALYWNNPTPFFPLYPLRTGSHPLL